MTLQNLSKIIDKYEQRNQKQHNGTAWSNTANPPALVIRG